MGISSRGDLARSLFLVVHAVLNLGTEDSDALMRDLRRLRADAEALDWQDALLLCQLLEAYWLARRDPVIGRVKGAAVSLYLMIIRDEVR